MLPPLKPIKIKDRVSLIFIEKGQVDVLNGAFVVIDEAGIRTQIPIGTVTCLMLEPGTRISHAAVKLSAKVGTLLIWVGEAGVRLYAAGFPAGTKADRLLYQAKLVMDDQARLNVARYMYKLRFKEEPPLRRSIDQLRGIEGARVRRLYQIYANTYGINWKGRQYDQNTWDNTDPINRCLSVATSCLYGIVEAAIIAAGYSPALGFIHTGKPLSFVYDIADIVKFEKLVPYAFKCAATVNENHERVIRIGCRNLFRETKLLDRLVPLIDDVLSAGGISLVKAPKDTLPVAIPNKKGIGDVGHRN